MVPAQPPLPTAWNFPFQSVVGSQTSILMSESAEGVSVAATRQKVGSWLNCGVAGPVPGRVNAPAGTTWTRLIEVFGSARDDKLSHDDEALRACPCVVSARRSAHDPPATIFIARSSEVPARGQQDKIHSLHRENRVACQSFQEDDTHWRSSTSVTDSKDILDLYKGNYFFIDPLLAHWIRRKGTNWLRQMALPQTA